MPRQHRVQFNSEQWQRLCEASARAGFTSKTAQTKNVAEYLLYVTNVEPEAEAKHDKRKQG